MKKRMLILEDGTIFIGKAFGSDEASIGETVFTTGMTGYQEAISNPSNCGQIDSHDVSTNRELRYKSR